MARLIHIRKIEEDARYVWYEVFDCTHIGGTLIYDKRDRVISELIISPDQECRREYITGNAYRAVYKITKSLDNGICPLPEILDWIS